VHYLIWGTVAVICVVKGPVEFAVAAVVLALVLIVGRSGIIPRLRRQWKKAARQRQMERAGLDAELAVKARLEERGLLVLHDVYLQNPEKGGALTQVDLIALGCCGIHVLEVKAHVATVCVDPLASEWTADYPSGYQAKLYSPIMQNDGHIAAVKAMAGEGVPVNGAVIFPGATLTFIGPTAGVYTDLPDELEAGAPDDVVVGAWDRLAEHDRICAKDQCRQSHLAALAAPKVFDDSPELRKLKRDARATWIRGCQAELSTEAKLGEIRKLITVTMPAATEDEVAAICRYAQANVTQREIASQPVTHGSLVEARRSALGKRWLDPDEFQRACGQERRYMKGNRVFHRRSLESVGGERITKGEILYIAAVFIGVLGRLGH
jgi:hypothetical protein